METRGRHPVSVPIPTPTFPVNGKDFTDHNNRPPRNKCLNFLIENWLTIATFSCVLLGVLVGFLIRNSSDEEFSQRTVMYIMFPGELFLRMLKGLILPLIVASLISAIGSLDTSLSGKIGARAVAYYMVTTVMAIILGIILVLSIRPGKGSSEGQFDSKQGKVITTADTLLDLLRNMFPPNLIEACFAQYSTKLVEPELNLNASINYTIPATEWKIQEGGVYGGGTNILGLVVFSVVMGIVLGKMGPKGEPLLNVFMSLGDAMMMITKLVIWLSPVGVFFLITAKIVEMKDLGFLAGQLGMYTLTVLVGLFIHGLVVLPLLYVVFLRRLPFKYLSGIIQALTTAFATSSSSATLPVTFSCLEDNNGVDRRISRFCLPIGATINMDGTALYEAVAAIFIAQMRDIPMDAGKIAVISITATAASIGAAGIPQAGLVTMVMVLNAVGLPADDVALIFAVDWLLDRFRTAINVLGDAIGAAIVEHLSKDDLRQMDDANRALDNFDDLTDDTVNFKSLNEAK